MAHRDYTFWMSLALDAMLTPDEERHLQEHLQGCSDCRATWALWQQLDRQLRAMPMATPAPGFAMRVSSRLRARMLRRCSIAGGFLLTFGAIFLWIILLLGVLVAASWWLAHHLSLLVQGVNFAIQLLSTVFALLRGIRLAWESLLAPSAQPILLGCLAIWMGLTILWAQIMSRQRRPAP
ncbi:MAG: zf-HC2 domain-containing protein [Anaerolineae bacterium]|nr:zf-HC2 domain-containing protein [Anaerolineae bacterium]MDW8100277.1 zf-HC2 domain-containing protein [Anaerolineae bacterium]